MVRKPVILILVCTLCICIAPAGLFSQQKNHSLKIGDYYKLLDDIEDIAYEVEYSSDLSILNKQLRKLPDSISISYKDESDKYRKKTVSNLWIKRALRPNGGWSGIGIQDSLKMAYILAERIDSYRNELQETLGDQDTDTSAGDVVKNILEAERFKEKRQKEPEIHSNNVRERNVARSASWTYDNLPWIFFALMVLILIILMLSINKQVDFEKVSDDIRVEPGKGLLREGEPTQSDQMRRLAEDARAAGKRAAAVRYFYLYFILLLHERKVLSYRASYTTWEYYQMLVSRGFPVRAVYQFTETFDRSTYGLKEVDEALLASFNQNIELSVLALNKEEGK